MQVPGKIAGEVSVTALGQSGGSLGRGVQHEHFPNWRIPCLVVQLTEKTWLMLVFRKRKITTRLYQ